MTLSIDKVFVWIVAGLIAAAVVWSCLLIHHNYSLRGELSVTVKDKTVIEQQLDKVQDENISLYDELEKLKTKSTECKTELKIARKSKN